MDGHHAGEHGSHDSYDHGGNEPGRVTSPMQEFSTNQVGIGFAVLVVGLLVVFGVPLLLG